MAKLNTENDILITKQNLEAALGEAKSYVDEKDAAINDVIGQYPSLVDQEVEGQTVPGTPPIATRLAALEGRVSIVENSTTTSTAITQLGNSIEAVGNRVVDLEDAIGTYPDVEDVIGWTYIGSIAENQEQYPSAITVATYSDLPSTAEDQEVYLVENDDVHHNSGYYRRDAANDVQGAGTISDRLDTLEDDVDALEARITNLDLFTKRIVTALPAVAEASSNVLYIVPDESTSATEGNSFIEYILIEEATKLRDDYEGDPEQATAEDYVTVPAHFEEIGRATSRVDLSGYYNKSEVDAAILAAAFDDTAIQADLTTIKTQIGTYPTTQQVEVDGSWEEVTDPTSMGGAEVSGTVANYSELPKRGIADGSYYATSENYTDPNSSVVYPATTYKFTAAFDTVATKNIATRLDEIDTKLDGINVMTQAEVETMCDTIFGTTTPVTPNP